MYFKFLGEALEMNTLNGSSIRKYIFKRYIKKQIRVAVISEIFTNRFIPIKHRIPNCPVITTCGLNVDLKSKLKSTFLTLY